MLTLLSATFLRFDGRKHRFASAIALFLRAGDNGGTHSGIAFAAHEFLVAAIAFHGGFAAIRSHLTCPLFGAMKLYLTVMEQQL